MDMKTSRLALLKDPSFLKTDALNNGQWVKGSSRFDIHDPATGAKLADVANLGAAEAEQTIAAANNNAEFGFASDFSCRDVGRILRVSEALDCGMVGINVGVIATENVPFGGVKQSGLGNKPIHHKANSIHRNWRTT
jgi:acyl-CoA reductase-like NAD-dependent aldehyde dehydrogenase